MYQIVKNGCFVKRACRKVEKMYDEIKKLKELILALRVSFFKETLTFETLSFLSDYFLSSNRGVHRPICGFVGGYHWVCPGRAFELGTVCMSICRPHAIGSRD